MPPTLQEWLDKTETDLRREIEIAVARGGVPLEKDWFFLGMFTAITDVRSLLEK